MAKQPKHHGKHWSDEELDQLRGLAEGNTPTRVIGLKLGRTPDAIASKAVDQAYEPVAVQPSEEVATPTNAVESAIALLMRSKTSDEGASLHQVHLLSDRS